MSEKMKEFLEVVTGNDEMRSKFNVATREEMIAMAKTLGVELTEADFEQKAAELDDDELDAVAGGGTCACVMGGGGTADNNDKTCVCVAFGEGEVKCGCIRCFCAAGGGGKDT